MTTYIRINGTAPAWPVLLERKHPFYLPGDPFSLASTSYSVCGSNNLKGNHKDIQWEILIDAGHQTVPFLLNHGNRIPDAIILTHGHPDHILGVDWIIQSHRFGARGNNRLPLYCTMGVWNSIIKSYPHIAPYTEHRELIAGMKTIIQETDTLSVTSFPVYHGGGAPGASMLLFSYSEKNSAQVLITGDMLCPLLRKKDYELIGKSQVMFIDTNNRFPDPESNHISFTRLDPNTGKESNRLLNWFKNKHIDELIEPHRSDNKELKTYFRELLSDWNHISEIPHTILDFVQRINIPEVYLVHYWGLYDEKYYQQLLMNSAGLIKWANSRAEQEGIRNTRFNVPKTGEIIYF